MLVEINLLPRKEFKNRAIFIIVALILIVLIGGASFVYTLYSKSSETDQQLKNQIAAIQGQRAAEEKKFSVDQESANVIKLEKTVNWADDYFVETVPLLNHLSGLLPERGFIQAFSYVEDGIVSLVIQFDTNTEIAHYIAALNDSEYISQTKLNSVTTTPMEEEQELLDQALAAIQEIQNANQDETTNTEGTTENTSEQSVEEDSKKEQEEEKELIPRYLAQFELTINKEALKALQKEGK